MKGSVDCALLCRAIRVLQGGFWPGPVRNVQGAILLLSEGEIDPFEASA